jgi:hypothetical protein
MYIYVTLLNSKGSIMQEFIASADADYKVGQKVDGYIVVNVSHEFPENGFSYEDMRAGICRAYVRVTMELDS